MPKLRVHNFSISLDGFATGEDLSFDAPFGHAGLPWLGHATQLYPAGQEFAAQLADEVM